MKYASIGDFYTYHIVEKQMLRWACAKYRLVKALSGQIYKVWNLDVDEDSE